MDQQQIIQALERFFIEEEQLHDPSMLSDGTDLIDAGIMDSLMLVALVGYCEERFNCTLEPHELTEDNFRSMDRIAAYIESKLARTA